MKKIITSVIVLFFVVSSVEAQKQFKALLVTTTRGWHHESLHYGVVALNKLATQNNFDLVLMQDPNSINDKYLADFQVVIFLCTTGDIFDSAQQKVFERYIQSGKGYVGVHSASDTEYDWDWYNKLVGRMFHIHPAIQTARLQVLNSSFPGMTSFTNNQLWTEEWYEFGPEKISGLNYLLSVDEKTYNPVTNWGVKKGNGMGALHPISWYHEFDGGRSFYTALGHMPTDFENESFLNHLYGGIYWAATGKK
ncbi:MAG: ThuA domain-containing protein [Sphingobacteriales bacterium]|nr:ThuA domain-containing protein [Sphingobacteriales bacterium]MBI3717609.1 ThuA domain-containing protein [Sphingobacteriales bacterium]